MLNMFLRFYFRRRICFLRCILRRAYCAEPNAAPPPSPRGEGCQGSRSAEGRPRGVGAARDGSEKRGSRGGVCPKCFPGLWASGTFHAHLAMGMDVLCICGVLGRGGSHDIHRGREEPVCQEHETLGAPRIVECCLAFSRDEQAESLSGRTVGAGGPVSLPSHSGGPCLPCRLTPVFEIC